MLQNMFQLIGLCTAPRRNVRQNWILAEVIADHVGYVGVHELVVRDPRTGSIGQGYVALRPCTHQSRDAKRGVCSEGLGIEEVIVNPSVDHIDPCPAVDRLHVNAVILVYGKIFSFHEDDCVYMQTIDGWTRVD